MSNIVTIINNTAVTSSLAVAEGTGNSHKNVLGLIRDYLSDLEEFGGVAFESQPFNTAGGIQRREVAILNEPQATLLLTYMRNNDVIRIFKKALVREFWEMDKRLSSQHLALPRTFAEALRLAADQQEQLEAQHALIEQQKPAVEFVESYVESSGAKGFREVAKLLQIKEPVFRKFLQEKRIMYVLGGNWTAYGNHIDAGRFEVKTGTSTNADHSFLSAKFTPKGVAWVAQLWRDHENSFVH